jgi:2-C-methyl-D-erythritol 4-phosphate cytidylyltransferase
MRETCTAIVVAAGSSQRMGFDKLFALLGDKPVIAHTLEAFARAECVDEIVLVARDDRLPELQELVKRAEWKKVRHVISGGERRQDSVRAGLNVLVHDARYVAVHDAARPLITSGQIGRVFANCQVHGAAALAEPITDTLKRADQECFVCGGVDRAGLYAMQTPQIFARDLLVEAYAAVAARELSITDEVSAVELVGAKVVLVPNDEFNPKITYPRDLMLAQAFLNRRPSS